MNAQLPQELMTARAYSHPADDLQLIETHISWVVLAGSWAYKIKKPIRNSFLDYTSREARHRYCEAELRLNRRFSPDLYVDVVPITMDDGQVKVAGNGEVIESAVRMRRFSPDALMSQRLAAGLVPTADVRSLAAKVADFHCDADRAAHRSPYGSPDEVFTQAIDNCRDIVQTRIMERLDADEQLLPSQIEQWTRAYFADHRELFELRKREGHIRECHGDLHLSNIVWWQNAYVPFDGIEFSEEFRWIDTLSDAAFTAMDLAAAKHIAFSRSFANAYLESTGDYTAVRVLRWYLVFRAMVRAKVAALRAMQLSNTSPDYASTLEGFNQHLNLAWQYASGRQAKPAMWITHGVSGSGKTTGSESVIQQQAAFRIRADVERKRIEGVNLELYSPEMNARTYQRLEQLAEQLLASGESVVVDATFLKKAQRAVFMQLARRLAVPFRILHFEADRHTLQTRVAQRLRAGLDASDANAAIVEQQLAMQEPLDDEEQTCVCN